MTLGVKRGTVKIVPYDSNWIKAFENEKTLLISIFKENCLQIEHIGSTSIPNLTSKPIIDIAIKVKSLAQVTHLKNSLEKHGYIERVGRLKGKQLVFAKEVNTIVTHHLHIIEEGELDWDMKLNFKNKLLSNPKLISEYALLKLSLYKKYSNDRLAYTNSKALFIKMVQNNIIKKT